MKLSTTSSTLSVMFVEGNLSGQTYEMGGERLGDGGFWVHPPTIKKIEPVVGKPTREELSELIKEIKKYCEGHTFGNPNFYVDFSAFEEV